MLVLVGYVVDVDDYRCAVVGIDDVAADDCDDIDDGCYYLVVTEDDAFANDDDAVVAGDDWPTAVMMTMMRWVVD